MDKKTYKKQRNILRNNVPKRLRYTISAGTFAGHCLVNKYRLWEKIVLQRTLAKV